MAPDCETRKSLAVLPHDDEDWGRSNDGAKWSINAEEGVLLIQSKTGGGEDGAKGRLSTKEPILRQIRLIWLSISGLVLLMGCFAVYCFLTRPSDASAASIGPVRPALVTRTPLETNLVAQLGWLDALEKLREDLGTEAFKMSIHEEKQAAARSHTIDISGLYNLISYALDNVGLHGVWFSWFLHLEQYLQDEDDDCGGEAEHGMGCGSYSIWWLRHYVGAVTAAKVHKEGSILLDPSTGARAHGVMSVMKEIQRMQRMPSTGAQSMSYHAGHGFVWHHVVETLPDMESYPVDLARELCGEQGVKDFRHPIAHKNIRRECYHGFGHAVFMIMALRQSGRMDNYTATTMFRPNSDLVLTNDTICDAVNICSTASEEDGEPYLRCLGGFRHSLGLFDDTYQDQKERAALMGAHVERCQAVNT